MSSVNKGKNKKPTEVIIKPDRTQFYSWAVLGLIMIFVTVIRIRILGIPLERDEGEYAYMGQLILQGISPYKIAYNLKFPGTYYMYAFFMSIFGQSVTAIHIGLLIVNLFSIILLYLLVKKLISSYAAIAAAACFAIMSISIPVYGFAGHATHFVLLFALAGTLLLFKSITENKFSYYFWAGLLLGFAPIMKQPGVFFPLSGGLFLLISSFINWKSGRKVLAKRIIYFAAGGIIPLLLMAVFLKISGVFDRFWFWTIKYAFEYGQSTTANEAYNHFTSTFIPLWDSFYPLLILAALGLPALFFHPELRKDQRKLFILLFVLFSVLSICPGLVFREHYYITLLPAVAILFAVFIDYGLELSKQFSRLKLIKHLSFILLIIAAAAGIIKQYDYLFVQSPEDICRSVYGSNPFPESIAIAKYIEANSKKDDKIAILGSEPELYFYANRHSASGYIYTYSLMDNQPDSLKMQQEMISEIESSMPEYVIYFNIPSSWMMRPNSDKYIFSWIGPFLDKNKYEIKAIGDVLPDETIMKWDSEALNYNLQSKYFILVLRKPHSPLTGN